MHIQIQHNMRKLLIIALLLTSTIFSQAQLKKTFVPIAGQKYYLKTEYVSTSISKGFMSETNTGIYLLKKYDNNKALIPDSARWYISYTEGKGYSFQNVATGNYVTFKQRELRNGIIPTKKAGNDSTYFRMTIGHASFFLGNLRAAHAEIQPWGIQPKDTTEALDVSTTTFINIGAWAWVPTKLNQGWMVLTDAELDAFSAPTPTFLPTNGVAYTIRPKNFHVLPVGITNPTPAELAADEANRLNCRVSYTGGTDLYLYLYNADDKMQQWIVTPVDGSPTKFRFKNAFANKDNTGFGYTDDNYLTLRRVNAKVSATVVPIDGTDADLTITFLDHIKNEFGLWEEYYSIANSNSTAASTKNFYLDMWNGSMWADQVLGVWGYTVPDVAHRYMIRQTGYGSNGITPISINHTQIYSHRGTIYINNSENQPIQISTIDGRVIFTKKAAGSMETIATRKGIYLVKAGTQIQKVVVQ